MNGVFRPIHGSLGRFTLSGCGGLSLVARGFDLEALA